MSPSGALPELASGCVLVLVAQETTNRPPVTAHHAHAAIGARRHLAAHAPLPIRDFRIIAAFRAIVLSPNRKQKMTDDTSPVNLAWRFL